MPASTCCARRVQTARRHAGRLADEPHRTGPRRRRNHRPARRRRLKLVALFSPEHGIRGILDATVPSTTDEKTGLPIHSLYGTTRRPSAETLAGLDAIVIDVQDIGTRFYTS